MSSATLLIEVHLGSTAYGSVYRKERRGREQVNGKFVRLDTCNDGATWCVRVDKLPRDIDRRGYE